MGFHINPIRKDVGTPEAIAPTKSTPQDAETTAKVKKVAKLPVPKEVVGKKRQITPLNEAKYLAKEIQKNWHSWELETLAEKIIGLEDKVALLKGLSTQDKKMIELANRLHFLFVHPLGVEFERKRDSLMPESFAQSIRGLAREIADQNSLEPFKGLEESQKNEILRFVGSGASPEGIAHAMEEYIQSLEQQMNVAEDFFFGRLGLAMEGFIKLPEDVRLKIDQIIWNTAGGNPIDPTEKESQSLIAAAIMRSLEQRMGM